MDGRGSVKDGSAVLGWCSNSLKQATLKEDLVTEKDCEFEVPT